MHLFVGIAIAYLVCGIIWMIHDRNRSPLHRPPGYASLVGTIFLTLIWPIRIMAAAKENVDLRATNDRYLVDWNGPANSSEENRKAFAQWEDALEFAINMAKEIDSGKSSDAAASLPQIVIIRDAASGSLYNVTKDGTHSKIS